MPGKKMKCRKSSGHTKKKGQQTASKSQQPMPGKIQCFGIKKNKYIVNELFTLKENIVS